MRLKLIGNITFFLSYKRFLQKNILVITDFQSIKMHFFIFDSKILCFFILIFLVFPKF